MCRFFSIYQRCKFGEYCAFKHCDHSEKEEIKNLKDKVKSLEVKDIEKSSKISELYERLEMLYATVEQIVAEREETFIQAVKPSEKTPTVKTKKIKQHPTPSPTHHQPVQSSGRHHEQGDGLLSPAHHPDLDEKVLTAEEIAKLYEEEDDPDKE